MNRPTSAAPATVGPHRPRSRRLRAAGPHVRPRPHRPRIAGDSRAVSNVLAAVLIFALVVMALVMVRVTFVPAWEADREAVHMEKVQGEFVALKAELDRQAANRTGGVMVSSPVTLAQQQAGRLFSDPVMPGELRFEPRTALGAGRLSASEMLIFVEDDQDLFGIDEDWTVVPSQGTVEDIRLVQHLRIRVNDPASLSGPPHGTDKGGVSLTVRDRDGAFAGDIRVYVSSHASGYNVNTRVRDADLEVLYDQGHSYFRQDEPAMYWVNGLSHENQFRSVLAAARAPLHLEWSQNVLTGSYTISYLEQVAGGSVQVGGSGRLELDWERTHAPGTLVHASRNSHFPDQDIHLEHGGIILAQQDGAVLLSPPHFEAAVVGTRVLVSFTAIGLSGTENLATHSGAVPVHLLATDHTALQASAPSFTWDYPTAFPELWAAFWRDRLAAAGLDEAAGHFSVTTSADAARLDLYGPITDPLSTEHDLSLSIRQSTVQVVIGI